MDIQKKSQSQHANDHDKSSRDIKKSQEKENSHGIKAMGKKFLWYIQDIDKGPLQPRQRSKDLLWCNHESTQHETKPSKNMINETMMSSLTGTKELNQFRLSMKKDKSKYSSYWSPWKNIVPTLLEGELFRISHERTREQKLTWLSVVDSDPLINTSVDITHCTNPLGPYFPCPAAVTNNIHQHMAFHRSK